MRTLCKQSPKRVKECYHEFGMKPTPGKVDMGNSMVLILSFLK